MEDYGSLGIEEEGTYFGLSDRCGNKLEDGASNVDGAIEFD